ncbi:hypothetical protein ACFFRR_001739 [Megaselia abdita]
MYDLNTILKIFEENKFSMDFHKDFDVVKRILEYVNLNIKSLDKIQYKSGNEHVIDEISKRLKKHFMDNDYIDSEQQPKLKKYEFNLQKIVLFLALNTDISYKYDLRKDQELAHVLDMTPQISKCVLISVMWETNLDHIFYQLLSYTPCWFSFQLFDQACRSLKNISDPFETLVKVENLVKAVFTSITLSETRNMDKVDKKIIFEKLFTNVVDILRQFYTPDSEKFKTFSKKKLSRYSGFAIKHILDMVFHCFDLYEGKIPLKLEKCYEIFEVFKSLSPKCNTDGPSEVLKESQMKIITCLLNSLQYIVFLITIDVFMYWMEIEFPEENSNLQMIVGGKAYYVYERMKANPVFSHDVEAQLGTIAIRPKTFQETLKEATLGEILLKLEEDLPLNQKEKKMWLDELMLRNMALGNEECLETIQKNIKIMTPDNCEKILEYIKLNILSMESETEGDAEIIDIKEIHGDLFRVVLKALDQFTIDDVIQLLRLEIRTFGQKVTFAEQDNFSHRSIEFFNKYEMTFDTHEFLKLCFENPLQMWLKFFEVSCHSELQIKNLCKTAKKMFKLSEFYINEMMNTLFEKNKFEEKYIPHLITEIYIELFSLRKIEFFKLYINKNINILLEHEVFDKIAVVIKSLNMIANRNTGPKILNFGEATAPVLLMAAQIMDKCRWDLISYSDVRDEIVRGSVDLIQNVSKKHLPLASERDKKWIHRAIKGSYKPTTEYYFQRYGLHVGEQPLTFDQFIIQQQITTKPEIETVLIINFVRCTTKETEWLAKSDILLPNISDMMLTLSNVVSETNNEYTVNNYRHCVVNYVNIVRKFLVPELKSSIQIFELGFHLLKIVNSSPKDIYEEIYMELQNVVLDILGIANGNIEEQFFEDIQQFTKTMVDCKGKEIFTEKLNKMFETS